MAQVSLVIDPETISLTDQRVALVLAALQQICADTPIASFSFQERATDPGFSDLSVRAADGRVWITTMQFNGAASDADPGITIHSPSAWRDHTLGFFRTLREEIVKARNEVGLRSFSAVWSSVPAFLLSAAPATIHVGEIFNVGWFAQVPHPTDWIGLYAVGAADNVFGEWRYTDGAAVGEMPFRAVAPGVFELRFFSANGYTLLASAGPVTVVP